MSNLLFFHRTRTKGFSEANEEVVNNKNDIRIRRIMAWSVFEKQVQFNVTAEYRDGDRVN